VLETLPLALAIAASPFPIIPAILLLFTERPRATSSAFLAGWVAGIAFATTLFALVSEFIELTDHPPLWASAARLALGAALLILGIRQWVTRRRADELPTWMRAIDSATPRSALRLALVLSVANPKILLLAAAAGLTIGSSGEEASVIVTSIALFTAVAALSVAVPVALFAIRGSRVLGPLGVLRTWLQHNNATIMAVVILVIGAMLTIKGATALW
jgi:hypothetical protein